MNSNESETHALQDRLELLVDGELPDRERAKLLLELDTIPGGWRQCGLNFLETQAMQKAFSGMAPSRRTGLHYLRAAAMAAALLALFLGGLAVGRATQAPLAGDPSTGTQVTESRPPLESYPSFMESSLSENGRPLYSTSYPLPPFMIDSLHQAGHEVKVVHRTVELASDNGPPHRLPLLETHIVVDEPL